MKGFSWQGGNNFPTNSEAGAAVEGIPRSAASASNGTRLAFKNTRNRYAGGNMCNRFCGSARVVLVVLAFGLLCGISAQGQMTTDASDKSVQPLSGSAHDGSAAAEMTASSKPGVPSVEDSSSPSSSVHPDLKSTAAPKNNDKVDKASDSYVVGIADGLFISVWKEPDLSGAVVVRPDGIITVPVIGDVHVAGLTTPQVQDLLSQKLKDVVAEPQVSVIVRDIRSRRAYLVGKVGRPGQISLTTPETVLQLLAEAGGPAPLAKPQKMYVLRTVDGKQTRIDFNYKKALKGSQPDLQVEVGDIIVVP
jgi:polysaccharide biosynthesis/export protein